MYAAGKGGNQVAKLPKSEAGPIPASYGAVCAVFKNYIRKKADGQMTNRYCPPSLAEHWTLLATGKLETRPNQECYQYLNKM